jgi:gliding motility-associated-like protein
MLQPLNAPAVTVGPITANSVSFSWQAVTGATGYEVSLDNGQNFITPSSGATGLTHMVSNLQPGQSVSIIVRAIGKTACELSANSAVVTASSDNPFGDNVYVPNAFTPNGDGKNDTFLAYSNNMQKIMLSVYNQWGELIYRTTDKSAGWDGTYKGHDQPVGVYVYYLEATMIDGHSVNKKGTVTLLR